MAERKIKILYVISGLVIGGAEKHLIDLVNGLDREKFEPFVCCLCYRGEQFAKIGRLGIQTFVLNVKRIYGISGILGLFKLVEIIKRKKINLVHSYLFSENILAALAAYLTGVKILTGRRDTGMLREGKLRHILAYRLTNRWVDRVVCVSNAVREVVKRKEKIDDDKLEVIYNGVGLSEFTVHSSRFTVKKALNIDEDDFVVGMIANFSWIKGHKEFLQAAKLVLKELPNTKFLLAGEGPLLANYRLQIASSQLKDKVLFLGSRRDIPQLLSIMDVSVNASYSEGMSNTILESMAAGVPVVATAVDGNLETVVDKKTGILVPPANPRALAEAIIKLLRNKELRQNLGQRGQKLVEERFSFRIMLSNFERLYQRLTAPKIAFILSQFPETHETFILRELFALKEGNLNYVIFSLKRCRDKVIHPEANKLLDLTIYGKVYSLWSIVYGLRHPVRTMNAFLYLIRTYYKKPKELVKALYVFLECFCFVRVIKKEKSTHIHAHWASMPTTAAIVLSKLCNISFSFTAHAWDIFISQDGLAEKIEKSEFVVTCTDYNRRYLANLAGESQAKIYLNYHGLDLDKWGNDGVMTKELNVLAIGRLVETKGFEYLIEACAILKKRQIEFKCWIVGDGPLKNSLQRKVCTQQLENNVQFLGIKTQAEIKELYRKATVLVQPSVIAKNGDRDGIPNVILEAMAMGVPVISTRVSGIPEVVKDGLTGILVGERDSRVLAESIERLLNDKMLQKTLAENSRKIVEERFEINKNVEQLIKILQMPINRQTKIGESIKKRQTRTINVLYIIWSLDLGGAERSLINTVKHLDKRCFHPLVCCLNGKGKFARELEEIGVLVIPLNKRGKFDISVIRKIISIIKEYRIDIVHTHLWGANFWGRIAARGAAVKCVIAQEHGIERWRTKLHFMLDRILAPFTDKIIFVSESAKKLYIAKTGINSEKCVVIYNGVALNQSIACSAQRTIKKQLGIKDSEAVLAIIGRLVPEKGHRYLFEALAGLNGKYNIKLLVVGEGPLKESLYSTVCRLNLQDSVSFLGLRRDIARILAVTELVVLPSLKEGMPLVLLEAMAQGRAVVATKVGAVAELVQDGVTGRLVRPESVAELSAAIAELLADRDKLRQFCRNSRKRILERFSIQSSVEALEKLYQQCLRKDIH